MLFLLIVGAAYLFGGIKGAIIAAVVVFAWELLAHFSDYD